MIRGAGDGEATQSQPDLVRVVLQGTDAMATASEYYSVRIGSRQLSTSFTRARWPQQGP